MNLHNNRYDNFYDFNCPTTGCGKIESTNSQLVPRSTFFVLETSSTERDISRFIFRHNHNEVTMSMPLSIVDPLIEMEERIPVTTSSAISELRRLSGLTWDQLARVFNVTRRSIHFWASGETLNAANEEKVYQTLALIREIDRGSAQANRSALLEVVGEKSAFDLLAEQRFDEVRTLLGKGCGRKTIKRVELSEEAKKDRMPLPPEFLVNALQDNVHREVGRTRPARTTRIKLRGKS